jgi:hypothetical protein
MVDVFAAPSAVRTEAFAAPAPFSARAFMLDFERELAELLRSGSTDSDAAAAEADPEGAGAESGAITPVSVRFVVPRRRQSGNLHACCYIVQPHTYRRQITIAKT